MKGPGGPGGQEARGGVLKHINDTKVCLPF